MRLGPGDIQKNEGKNLLSNFRLFYLAGNGAARPAKKKFPQE